MAVPKLPPPNTTTLDVLRSASDMPPLPPPSLRRLIFDHRTSFLHSATSVVVVGGDALFVRVRGDEDDDEDEDEDEVLCSSVDVSTVVVVLDADDEDELIRKLRKNEDGWNEI